MADLSHFPSSLQKRNRRRPLTQHTWQLHECVLWILKDHANWWASNLLVYVTLCPIGVCECVSLSVWKSVCVLVRASSSHLPACRVGFVACSHRLELLASGVGRKEIRDGFCHLQRKNSATCIRRHLRSIMSPQQKSTRCHRVSGTIHCLFDTRLIPSQERPLGNPMS